MLPNSDYTLYANFYDELKGNRSDSVNTIVRLIRHYSPGAQTVLELGCGTGEILRQLQPLYTVLGLDSSAKMLEVAKRKLPTDCLYHDDMRFFHLGSVFEVILCVHNTFQHLKSLSAYRKTLKNAREHLAENGLFIIEYNSVVFMDHLATLLPTHHQLHGSTAVVWVQRHRMQQGKYTWHVRNYTRNSSHGATIAITIKTYPLEEFLLLCQQYFTVLDVQDNTAQESGLGRTIIILRKT